MKKALLLPLFALLCCHNCLWSQFIDVGATFDIHNFNANTYIGNGSSGADFNQDGWDDITTASGGSLPRFFQSNNGFLEEVYFPLDIQSGPSVISVQWIDYDGDQDLDLFFDQYGGRLYLYQNDGNLNFTDVTASSGLGTSSANYYGTSWCDYDKDGDLDVFISKYYLYPPNPNANMSSKLHRNNGDATFTDVTTAAGLSFIASPTFQGTWMDIDEDGWQDLYIIIDRENYQNRLFHNLQNGTFQDISADTGLNLFIDAMSITPGDFDHDDDLDIFIANGIDGNYLMQNNGESYFTNIAAEADVEVNAICWGSNWIDYNNDTWEDLFVSANYGPYGQYPNFFFTQDGTLPFATSSAALGFGTDNNPTFCSTMADWNNDGYFDLYNNNNDPFESDFWQNQGGENNWLGVRLEGVLSNTFGVGSQLKLWNNGEVQNRYTHVGESYLSQHSFSEIFGLGAIDRVDSLEIIWPNGLVEHYENLPINQYIHLIEGETLQRSPVASSTLICANENITLDAGIADEIEWNTGATSQTIEVSNAGSYWFTASHGGGWIIHSDTITINSSPILSLEPVVDSIICFGQNNGNINIPPHPNISEINWANNAVGFSLSNLGEGTYTCEITKLDGCIETLEFNLFQAPPIESIAVNIVAGTCPNDNNGHIEVLDILGGMPPFTVLYPEDNGFLEEGSYTLQYTDALGCTSDYDFNIEFPAPIGISLNTVQPSCSDSNDGSISILDITGGSPEYTVEWDVDDIQHLEAGEYNVQVTDINGCSLNQSVSLIAPDPLTLFFTVEHEVENDHLGSITVTVDGGTAPYSYQWSTGQLLPAITELSNGDYSITITDMNGCLVQGSATIEFVTLIQDRELVSGDFIIFPNPAQDHIYWKSPEAVEELIVFDITGRIVIYEKPEKEAGDITTESLSTGSYLLKVKTKKGSEITTPFEIIR